MSASIKCKRNDAKDQDFNVQRWLMLIHIFKCDYSCLLHNFRIKWEHTHTHTNTRPRTIVIPVRKIMFALVMSKPFSLSNIYQVFVCVCSVRCSQRPQCQQMRRTETDLEAADAVAARNIRRRRKRTKTKKMNKLFNVSWHKSSFFMGLISQWLHAR